MRKQILAAVLAVGLFSFGAQAYSSSGNGMDGVVLNPAFSYISTTTTDVAGATTTVTATYLDFAATYLMMNGLYLGGKYASDSFSTSGSSSSSGSLYAFGPTIGFNYRGLFIDFTYYLASQYQKAANEIYKSGSGIGLSVGYNFYFDKFFLGPQFTYKSLTYSKESTGGADFTPANNYKYSEIVPFVQFGVIL